MRYLAWTVVAALTVVAVISIWGLVGAAFTRWDLTPPSTPPCPVTEEGIAACD